MPTIIGDSTFINFDCLIRPNVTIGKNVSIAMRISLVSDTPEMDSSKNRAGKAVFHSIKIGNGCWMQISFR